MMKGDCLLDNDVIESIPQMIMGLKMQNLSLDDFHIVILNPKRKIKKAVLEIEQTIKINDSEEIKCRTYIVPKKLIKEKRVTFFPNSYDLTDSKTFMKYVREEI